MDINGVGGATQPGFVALNPTGTDSNAEYTTQVTISDAFGTGLDATVSLHANRWKTRDSITGDFTVQSDLLYDFGGPVGDPSKPPTDATLSLLLPEGIFDIMLYHHESRRTYAIDAYLILTDADGTHAQETVTSSYGTTPTAINTYSTIIRSDGTNAITFYYDNTDGDNVDAFPISGFELSAQEVISSIAIQPRPQDNEVAVMLDTLLSWVWLEGTVPDSYDLYFGTDASFPGGPVAMGRTTIGYDPGLLDRATKYFWRVDPVIEGQPQQGTVWSFTTVLNDVVIRLNNKEPIIDMTFPNVGNNINGPSLIRIPNWIDPADRAVPSAVYYLYFAHHNGNHIRMAWASDIEGPYTMYDPGNGVLKLNINVGRLSISNHIASPDVLVEDHNQRIIMYFHGGTVRWEGVNRGQSTCVAVSREGLNFNTGVQETILGNFYFRVFEYGGDLYAIAKEGWVWKARDPADPWDPAGVDLTSTYLWDRSATNPFAGIGKTVRHNALRVVGDTLHVYYSCYPDMPERVLYSSIDMSSADWNYWVASSPIDVLEPELDWEGADLHLAWSREGSGTNLRELRDPALFQDADGLMYLLYTGEGEEAIGLTRFATNSGPPVDADFSGDQQVDMEDLAWLGLYWLNPYNMKDFSNLAKNWLAGVE